MDERRPSQPSLLLGTRTPWGPIVAVGWVGERYAWMIDRHGTVSMMPASVVEDAVEGSKADS
jgi:hypothetical protein